MRNSENAIEVTNLSKSFRVYFDKSNTLKEKIIIHRRNHYEIRKVLDDLSFEIKRGEAVGLIGTNGCGKSTTLKLLSKIIYPDRGKIETCGRVSSLIELGAGFHPDMSGRENIYTNASIFGLSKKEIDRRMDTIIQFSELEEFIDNPVRTYSSGMYMRLAFSVAINVDADILLIDEILAVGDINFQKKCLEKINQIKEQGTTIIIVSHSLSQIQEICNRVVWLDKGKLREDGMPEIVIEIYNREMENMRLAKARKEKSDIESLESSFNKEILRRGTGSMRFKSVHMYDSDGCRQDIFNQGDDFTIIAEYENDVTHVEDYNFSFSIAKKDGELCYATNSIIEDIHFNLQEKGTIEIAVKNCLLVKGEYLINLAISGQDGRIVDDLQRAAIFQIESAHNDLGIYRPCYTWKTNDQ